MSIPARMRAAVRSRYGPPEVVRIAEVDTPAPADDELLIRVRATTVNRTDCGYRGGTPLLIRFFSGFPRPKVPVLGTEFAGEVAAVGTGVTNFAVGDRVCGYCEGTFGAHAEYMTIAAKRLIAAIPEGSGYEEAAPAPRAPITRSACCGRPRRRPGNWCSSTALPGPSGRRRCRSPRASASR